MSKLGYRMHAFVCAHSRPGDSERGSCNGKNSLELMMKLKRMAREAGIDDVRVQKSGCLDNCENGPTCVVYPQGEWFCLTEDALPEMLEYLKGGKLPEKFLLKV